MKTRIILSAIFAAPFAVLSLAIADFASLPPAIRYAVSPGFIFGIHAAPSGSWIGDISDALRWALAGNEVYYAVLIFLALSWFRRKKLPRESAKEDEVIERRRQAM